MQSISSYLELNIITGHTALQGKWSTPSPEGVSRETRGIVVAEMQCSFQFSCEYGVCQCFKETVLWVSKSGFWSRFITPINTPSLKAQATVDQGHKQEWAILELARGVRSRYWIVFIDQRTRRMMPHRNNRTLHFRRWCLVWWKVAVSLTNNGKRRKMLPNMMPKRWRQTRNQDVNGIAFCEERRFCVTGCPLINPFMPLMRRVFWCLNKGSSSGLE